MPLERCEAGNMLLGSNRLVAPVSGSTTHATYLAPAACAGVFCLYPSNKPGVIHPANDTPLPAALVGRGIGRLFRRARVQLSSVISRGLPSTSTMRSIA